MGKEVPLSATAAGGGSPHSEPANLSSPILQKELERIYPASPPDTHSSLQAFIAHLSMPENSALAFADPEKKDWSRPLNEYFISSSHNTYLKGHQLWGSSTTKLYQKTLSRGCRCIEIDVWDGENNKPKVDHGYTFVAGKSFEGVCKAIRDHAFNGTVAEKFGGSGEGPVIVSLENHAGVEQQREVVNIMNRVWGDMLVQGIEPEEVKQLPSPNDLRRKILVKAKYTAPDPAASLPPAPLNSTANPQRASQNTTVPDDSSSSSDSDSGHKPKVIRPLAQLGKYASSHTFPGYAEYPEPFVNHPTSLIPNHVYSFSEKAFDSHAAEHVIGIFTHNKKFLMRVYPHGGRVSSSNPDPTKFWSRGVQIVALNWQKCDKGMMLNEGMFSGEGGYVLKPPGLKPGDLSSDLVLRKLDLTVEVVAGTNLALPDKSDRASGFEPYVKVEVHVGAPPLRPGNPVKFKSRTTKRRGVDCVWNEPVEFKAVPGIVEKLTLIRFKVHDEEFGKDGLSSWACIRLDRLQVGYRIIRLFDNRGLHSQGVLLVNVKKTVY